jgi:hypothetical protein
MKLKNVASHALFAAALLLSFSLAASKPVAAQKPDQSSAALQTATLLNGVKHNERIRSIFNFALGVRGDSNPPKNNLYDVRYGCMGIEDMDTFDVPINSDSYSQIKDLGELRWDEIYDTPILHASQWPHANGLKMDFSGGNGPVLTPANVVVKTLLGHIYLLHSKRDVTDIYVLFRVEALKPEDECTISWKIVASPEEIK